MAYSKENKEKKTTYQAPVVIKLDEVTTASGQQPAGCTAGSAATSCATGAVTTSGFCSAGGTVSTGDGGGLEIGIIGI